MAVFQGVSCPNLDLIIHSPGGSIEATEAIVTYLRSKFTHIRAIVPQLAMSAAAMICCSADEIVMGKHSFLGPIDPQFILNTGVGVRSVSAESVLDQFDMAADECQDPARMGAWVPMLSQYGPDLLIKCRHAIELSPKLVQGWLEAYMFKQRTDKRKKAKKIAKWLSDPHEFNTHGRHISRQLLEEKDLKIVRLEEDERLQDAVLSLYHAATHCLNDLNQVVKIIENHTGRAYVKRKQPPPGLGVPLQLQHQPGPARPQPAPQNPAQPPVPNPNPSSP
jgi:hypothetical protein